MKIQFPPDEPTYNCEDMTIEFVAKIDGHPVTCAVTAEALEDHFGAASMRVDDLLQAFRTGRARIDDLARHYLTMDVGAPVILRSGHFRWKNAQPRERGA
ncbi:MAG: DUF1488 family protein [Burkholderiales bacterium]|nr:DUF1488 family protein [Burkholderiales bacterium]